MCKLRLSCLLIPMVFLAGCQQEKRANVNFEMGERAEIGPFTYVVVENAWLTQIGEGFQTRTPQGRFMVLSLSVTNNGTAESSVPLLTLENSRGQTFQELSDGAGVANWMGILRNIGPGQTVQGRVLFDVPASTYRLRLPDGGESGYEKYAWVNIPLRIDSGAEIQPALPDLK